MLAVFYPLAVVLIGIAGWLAGAGARLRARARRLCGASRLAGTAARYRRSGFVPAAVQVQPRCRADPVCRNDSGFQPCGMPDKPQLRAMISRSPRCTADNADVTAGLAAQQDRRPPLLDGRAAAAAAGIGSATQRAAAGLRPSQHRHPASRHHSDRPSTRPQARHIAVASSMRQRRPEAEPTRPDRNDRE